MLVDFEERVQRAAGRRESVCVNAASATCDRGHNVSSTFERRVHVVAIATPRLPTFDSRDTVNCDDRHQLVACKVQNWHTNASPFDVFYIAEVQEYEVKKV